MKKLFYLKKRGFTLIELLAVIVILAIILLIAMPIVLNVIQDARKGAFETTAMGLVKTAENECLTSLLTGPVIEREVVFSDYQMNDETLTFSGKGPKEGVIHINSNCEVAMAIYDESWCVIKEFSETSLTITNYDGNCQINEVITNPETPEEYIAAGYIPISTPDELNNIRYSVANTFGEGTDWEGTYTGGIDKKYFQTNDIDLDVAPYNQNTGWEPIGRDGVTNRTGWYYGGVVFTGVYDGNDYYINNLLIDLPEDPGDYEWDVAFFYYLGEEGIIRNLKLGDFAITATYSISSIVIYNEGLVENIFVKGSLTALETHVGEIGGIVYNNKPTGIVRNGAADIYVSGGQSLHSIGGIVSHNDGLIEMSKSKGQILHSNYPERSGGIASYNNGSISQCFSELYINGIYQFGGGLAGQNKGEIINSYATGIVRGRNDIGGFVGSILTSSSFISNSYSKGPVQISGTGSNRGGFIGSDYGSGNIIENSYWDITTSGFATSAGGVGRNTADMIYPYNQENTYIGWDFENIWAIDSLINGGYPYLRNNLPFN